MSRTKSGIDPEMIRELAQLLTETDLTEIEVQHADLRIRVARQLDRDSHGADGGGHAPARTGGGRRRPVPRRSRRRRMSRFIRAFLKSPMVGTAYLGAAPGAKPFFEVGSKVNQGDRVLIVEAMKTFNDIVAPRSGTVTAYLIEDKQPVEYNQPLMIIE